MELPDRRQNLDEKRIERRESLIYAVIVNLYLDEKRIERS